MLMPANAAGVEQRLRGAVWAVPDKRPKNGQKRAKMGRFWCLWKTFFCTCKQNVPQNIFTRFDALCMERSNTNEQLRGL
jgi:hypothetical protein